jgi:hypothetical protein
MIFESEITFVLSVLLYGIMLTTLVASASTYALYKWQELGRNRSRISTNAKAITFESAVAADAALETGRRRRVRFGS